MSVIPCFLYCSVPQYSRSSDEERRHKRAIDILTSRRLPQLRLVTYYYYYTAWCLIKKNHTEALARADGEKN